MANRKAILGGLLALGLSACHSSSDESLTSAAQRVVTGALKDPDSARFTSSFVVRRPADKDGFTAYAVCGLVDGRNSFGAFTGGSRFVVTGVYDRSGGPVGALYPSLDDGAKTGRGAADSTAPYRHETGWDHIYWNAYCVDAAHPKAYTLEP